MGVEVAKVVRRDRPELVEQLRAEPDVLAELAAVSVEQIREHVAAVERARARTHVRWLRPDLVDRDTRRLDLEHRGDSPLEADRDVAEPDRAMTLVEQRPGDDADRVREVDDPRVRSRELAHALGDLEHDRHRPHRLCEPAGTGRLLPDAAAGERNRLVGEPCRLTADPKLEQHEDRAVDRALEVAGDLERAVEALTLEHARGHVADDLATLGVDVVEHELGRPGSARARARGRRRAPACTSSRRR